jgi:hypothetical protein
MPATATTVPVTGSIRYAEGSWQLVLSERLGGHDTFLTGELQLGDRRLAVRIITLDDVTVLRGTDPRAFAEGGITCTGTLHLPHGARPRAVPADLDEAASAGQRSLAGLDDAELRYALTFLEEATTSKIRRARIDAIVAALPAAQELTAPVDPPPSGQAREPADGA